MPWTTEQIQGLISEVEARSSIWNVFCKDYKDRIKRNDAWREVAEKLQRDQTEVEKKFHSLRTQFAAEIKSKERRKPGSEDGTTTSKWQYMSSLSFLRRGMKRRHGSCAEVQVMESSFGGQLGSMGRENKEAGPPKRQLKKPTSDLSDDMLSQVMKVLKEPAPDHLDIFGQYVVTELRMIKSDQIRCQAKREISMAIIKAQEKEERMQSAQSSPGTSAAPPPICFEKSNASSNISSGQSLLPSNAVTVT